jgi:trehalose synthase
MRDEAAARMIQVLKDPRLRERLGARKGKRMRETLDSRLLEDGLDPLTTYERPVN